MSRQRWAARERFERLTGKPEGEGELISKALGKYRRNPLPPLEGEYEFAVIDQYPRSDGPQEPEFNRIEVRITPSAIMVRREWSLEWCVVTFDMIADADKFYDKVFEQAFHDGVQEAMAKTGVALVVSGGRAKSVATSGQNPDEVATRGQCSSTENH